MAMPANGTGVEVVSKINGSGVPEIFTRYSVPLAGRSRCGMKAQHLCRVANALPPDGVLSFDTIKDGHFMLRGLFWPAA